MRCISSHEKSRRYVCVATPIDYFLKMAADVQKRTEEKEIPDEIIVKLSSRCVLKPSLLARRLNLEETIFEQIEFAHPQDRYEQIYQILYKWRQSDPCPTLDKLSVAMDTGFAAVMEEYDQIDGIGHVTCKMNHVTGDKEGRVECDGPKPSKMRHIEQASDDNEDTDQSDDSEVPKLSDQSDDSCGPGTFDQSDEAIIPSAPPFHLLAAQSGDLPSSLPTIIRRTSTGQPLLVGPPVATSCPPLLPTNPLPPSASVSNMTVDDTALTCKLYIPVHMYI